MSDLRFYAACLSSYNAGILHGQWIEATTDVEEMGEAVAAMLKASKAPGAEEWAIHDYDGFFPRGLGEFPGLEVIAKWVEVIEAAEEHGLDAEVARKVAENYGEPHNGEFSEALECITDRYLGTHESLAAYAEHYLDETRGLEGVPDTLARYFDFQAFGRDLELGGDIFIIRVEGELRVFSGH